MTNQAAARQITTVGLTFMVKVVFSIRSAFGGGFCSVIGLARSPIIVVLI